MMKFTLILLAALSMTYSAWSGTEGGGGGGGICIAGKCKTLAEAGIRINDSGESRGNWYLSQEMVKEIAALTTALPWAKDQMKALVIGDLNTFYQVEEIDKKTLKAIRNDYLKVISDNQRKVSSKELEIFAVSNNKNTYLLPTFFELSLRQQALILIHEAIVRNFLSKNGSTLNLEAQRYALRFDGEYLDYVAQKDSENYSPLNFYRTLSSLFYDISGAHLALVLRYTSRKLGRGLGMGDFVDEVESFEHLGYNSPFKYYATESFIRNQATFLEFIKIFGDSRVSNSYEVDAWKVFGTEMLKKVCSESDDRFGRPLVGNVSNTLYFVKCDTVGTAALSFSYVGITCFNGESCNLKF